MIFCYFCTPISIANKERKAYRWPEKSSVYPERVVLHYNYPSNFVLSLQIYALQLQKSFNTKIQEYGPFWSSVSVEVTLNVNIAKILYAHQLQVVIWSFVVLSFFHMDDYKSTAVKFVKLKFLFLKLCYIISYPQQSFYLAWIWWNTTTSRQGKSDKVVLISIQLRNWLEAFSTDSVPAPFVHYRYRMKWHIQHINRIHSRVSPKLCYLIWLIQSV